MTGKGCAVNGCKNTTRSSKKANLNISFHGFPKDEKTRQIWIKACYREDDWTPGTSVICSAHFRNEDFENSLWNKLMVDKTRPKLRANAVPCYFINDGDVPSGLSPLGKRYTNLSSEYNSLQQKFFEVTAIPQFCIVGGCCSRSKRDVASFYSVPTALNFKNKTHLNKLSKLRRQKWLAAIKREDLTELKIKNEKVCSKHFITGRPADLEDIDHPDWVPTLHLGYSEEQAKETRKKLMIDVSPVKSNVKRQSTSGCQSSESKENKAQLNLVADFIKATFETDSDSSKGPYLNANNIVIVSEDPPDWRVKEEPDEIEIQENSLYSSQISHAPQLMNASVLKCRTCLNIIDSSGSYTLSMKCTPTEPHRTIKEMITFCIPQMEWTLSENDIICSRCLKSIKFCERFITNCLEVEAKLHDICDTRDLRNKHYEYYAVKPDRVHLNSNSSPLLDPITLDHSYIIKCNTQLKEGTSTEFSENSVEPVNALPVTAEEDLTEGAKQLTFPTFDSFAHTECEEVLFKSPNLLDTHIREAHSDSTVADTSSEKPVPKYSCNFCEKSFTNKFVCKIHLDRAHQDKKKYRKWYFCKECMVECDTFSDLIIHKRVHGFKCTICSKRCFSKKSLIAHKQIHPDKYFCERCGKGLKTKADLKVHAYTHKEPTFCAYDKCGFNCKSKEVFLYHMQTHKNENHYMCEKCSKCFLKKSSLLVHQKVVHEKIHSYQCTKCSRTFGMKKTLDNHYAVKHLVIKPYRCELCGLRFGRIDSLRNHNNRFHSIGLRTKLQKRRRNRFVKENSGAKLVRGSQTPKKI